MRGGLSPEPPFLGGHNINPSKRGHFEGHNRGASKHVFWENPPGGSPKGAVDSQKGVALSGVNNPHQREKSVGRS